MAESDCEYFKRVNKSIGEGIFAIGEGIFAIFSPIILTMGVVLFCGALFYASMSAFTTILALVNVIRPLGYSAQASPFFLAYGLCPSNSSTASACGWAIFWGLSIAALPGPRYYNGLVSCMKQRFHVANK